MECRKRVFPSLSQQKKGRASPQSASMPELWMGIVFLNCQQPESRLPTFLLCVHVWCQERVNQGTMTAWSHISNVSRHPSMSGGFHDPSKMLPKSLSCCEPNPKIPDRRSFLSKSSQQDEENGGSRNDLFVSLRCCGSESWLRGYLSASPGSSWVLQIEFVHKKVQEGFLVFILCLFFCVTFCITLAEGAVKKKRKLYGERTHPNKQNNRAKRTCERRGAVKLQGPKLIHRTKLQYPSPLLVSATSQTSKRKVCI